MVPRSALLLAGLVVVACASTSAPSTPTPTPRRAADPLADARALLAEGRPVLAHARILETTRFTPEVARVMIEAARAIGDDTLVPTVLHREFGDRLDTLGLDAEAESWVALRVAVIRLREGDTEGARSAMAELDGATRHILLARAELTPKPGPEQTRRAATHLRAAVASAEAGGGSRAELQAWRTLGFATYSAGDDTESLRAFERALARDARDERARLGAAWAAYRLGELPKALEHAARIDPDAVPEAAVVEAAVHLERCEHAAAAEALKAITAEGVQAPARAPSDRERTFAALAERARAEADGGSSERQRLGRRAERLWSGLRGALAAASAHAHRRRFDHVVRVAKGARATALWRSAMGASGCPAPSPTPSFASRAAQLDEAAGLVAGSTVSGVAPTTPEGRERALHRAEVLRTAALFSPDHGQAERWLREARVIYRRLAEAGVDELDLAALLRRSALQLGDVRFLEGDLAGARAAYDEAGAGSPTAGEARYLEYALAELERALGDAHGARRRLRALEAQARDRPRLRAAVKATLRELDGEE